MPHLSPQKPHRVLDEAQLDEAWLMAQRAR